MFANDNMMKNRVLFGLEAMVTLAEVSSPICCLSKSAFHNHKSACFSPIIIYSDRIDVVQ